MNESGCHQNSGIPLEALVAELKARREAAAGLFGGPTYFVEELGIFAEYVSEFGLELAQAPEEFARP
ncbi:MAG: hypothetical protein ACQKBV_12300, partial [Puniceicoccales bacterium]